MAYDPPIMSGTGMLAHRIGIEAAREWVGLYLDALEAAITRAGPGPAVH